MNYTLMLINLKDHFKVNKVTVCNQIIDKRTNKPTVLCLLRKDKVS